ncbi:MAG TPA: adenosylmethionine--8-amino-7-oxononanoate transaminase [Polyangiaceae bacterium]|nr:adenosylmethionine--8-amino-7-oxononanoate transaminase [Polyangiaceae bacterium]
MKLDEQDPDLLRFDRQHVWHPYAAVPSDEPRYLVTTAEGVEIELADGRRLIDGMSSWWAAILGYRHPELLRAAHVQLERLAHVMFGGLTHEPAVRLAARLLELAPAGLEHVFFCDSGSVSVEVALKMAVQYWVARGEQGRRRCLSLRGGYHGDTWGAMSLCDPEQGMHRSFTGLLAEQVFAPVPRSRFGSPADPADIAELSRLLDQHAAELCAVVLEPIVQGAGGMRFHSAALLSEIRRLCDTHGLLLIADEIATGFGRTGKLFACEHAGISPDILCIGKALTGGTLSFAATLASAEVARGIAAGAPGLLLHGPTFMGNPLACSVALEVLDVLSRFDWPARVAAIEEQLRRELEPCRSIKGVADVRVLGAIGVIELSQRIDLSKMVPELVSRGVWLRPFGKLLYCMPPFIISPDELGRITRAMREVVELPP